MLRVGEPAIRLRSSAMVRQIGGPSARNVVLCAVLLACGAPVVCRAQSNAPHSGTEPVTSSTARLTDLQQAFVTLADRVEPVVVTVFSTVAPHLGGDNDHVGHNPFGPAGMPRRSTGTGSGLIISSDGWVLTNEHVVGGADRVTVRLHDGREFAGMVRSDRRSDISLIKIEVSVPLPAAHLGDSEGVRIGQWAIAIGSPFRYEGSLSVGVISSLFRSERIPDYSVAEGARYYSNLIQTDAAINPGNSGGPLCNLDGDVVGINTAIESESGGSVGIGFAIPINEVKFVISQLREKGHVDYGYLGISPVTVTPTYAAVLGVASGALVERDPTSDTPAGKAGLVAGDVITAIDGKPVHNDMELHAIVSRTAPGTRVTLCVMHERHAQNVEVALTHLPDLPADPPRAPLKPRLGIEVQPLTKELVDDPAIWTHNNGVVIKSLAPDAAVSELADLSRGDIVIRVNDQPTPNVAAFLTATANIRSGDHVRLYYLAHNDGYARCFVIVPVD